MKRATAFLCGVILCSCITTAQNLIPNPGFEGYTNLPSDFSQWYLTLNWNNVNKRVQGWPFSTPDYFHKQGTKNAHLPDIETVAHIEPHSGDAVMGISAFYPADKDFREYLNVRLVRDLIPGETYTLSFYITNGEKMSHNSFTSGIDSLGIHFSVDPLQQKEREVIELEPSFYISDLIYTPEWRKIEVEFVATEAYKYMTIGNFRDDDHTNSQSFDPSVNCAYYFFDDFSLARKPSLYVNGQKDLCVGNTAVIRVYEGYLIGWADANDPETIISESTELVVSPEENTTYIAYGRYDTVKHAINVYPIPDVDLGNDTIICEGEQINLIAGNSSFLYLWNDNSKDSSKIVKTEGMYEVKMWNRCGEVKAKKYVKVEDCTCRALFPNSFTPNNDGLNEIYAPYNNCEYSDYNLRIYSRHGELLFESSDAGEGWNGNKGGRKLPTGTYVYQLDHQFREGERKEISGKFNLLR